MSYDITSRFFHWMEANNITRSEAAAALGVDERSLSTYRSRGLPRKKEARATQIMREHPASAFPPKQEDNRINVTFSDEDFALVEQATAIVGCTTTEFIHKATCAEAKKEIARKADQASSMVADDVPPYNPPKPTLPDISEEA